MYEQEIAAFKNLYERINLIYKNQSDCMGLASSNENMTYIARNYQISPSLYTAIKEFNNLNCSMEARYTTHLRSDKPFEVFIKLEINNEYRRFIRYARLTYVRDHWECFDSDDSLVKQLASCDRMLWIRYKHRMNWIHLFNYFNYHLF